MWRVFVLLLLMSESAFAGGVHMERFVRALEEADAVALAHFFIPEVQLTQVRITGKQRARRSVVARSTLVQDLGAELSVTVLWQGDDHARMRVIQEAAEDHDFVLERELAVWLGAAGQVVRVELLDLEAAYPAHPHPCPDTTIRRREIATLTGVLGLAQRAVRVRVFETVRQAGESFDPAVKSCNPKSGYVLRDHELVVQAQNGALLGYAHVGRAWGDQGFMLDTSSRFGELAAGGVRIYPVDGVGHVFVQRSAMDQQQSQLLQFALRDDGLRSLWNFAVAAPGLEWQLAAPQRGHVAAQCNGAPVSLQWRGDAFFFDKTQVSKRCAKAKWRQRNSVLHYGEGDLLRLAQRARAQRLAIEAETEPELSSESYEGEDLFR